MGKIIFSDDFKRDAVHQINERSYPVAEVLQRLGVSQHSLYAWKKKFSMPCAGRGDDQVSDFRRLEKNLARVTQEHYFLKRPLRTSPRMQKEVRVRCRASCDVFGSSGVSLPAHPSQRFLRLHQEPVEQISSGRCLPDGVHQECLKGQR